MKVKDFTQIIEESTNEVLKQWDETPGESKGMTSFLTKLLIRESCNRVGLEIMSHLQVQGIIEEE